MTRGNIANANATLRTQPINNGTTTRGLFRRVVNSAPGDQRNRYSLLSEPGETSALAGVNRVGSTAAVDMESSLLSVFVPQTQDKIDCSRFPEETSRNTFSRDELASSE